MNIRNVRRAYDTRRANHAIKVERKLIGRAAPQSRLNRADRAANAAMIPF